MLWEPQGGSCERCRLEGHLGGGGIASVGAGMDLSDVSAKISHTQRLARAGEEKVREAHGCPCFDQMTEYTVVSATKMGRRLMVWLGRQAWR